MPKAKKIILKFILPAVCAIFILLVLTFIIVTYNDDVKALNNSQFTEQLKLQKISNDIINGDFSVTGKIDSNKSKQFITPQNWVMQIKKGSKNQVELGDDTYGKYLDVKGYERFKIANKTDISRHYANEGTGSLLVNVTSGTTIRIYLYQYLATGEFTDRFIIIKHTFLTSGNKIINFAVDFSKLPARTAKVNINIGVDGHAKIYNLNFNKFQEANLLVVEGTITKISKVPNPQKSSYADCYYTAQLKVHNLLSGKTISEDIILVIPAFYKKSLTDFAKQLKLNQKIRLLITDFNNLSDDDKSIQQADDIEAFELDNYFCKNIAVIDRFEYRNKPVPFKNKKYSSSFKTSVNPPIPDDLKLAREQSIKEQLNYVNRQLKIIEGKETQINDAFNKAWQANQQRYKVFESDYIGGYIGKGFFTLPKKYKLLDYSPQWEYNIAAIKAYNEFFQQQGVQFIIQLLPDYFQVSARVFNPEFAKYPDLQALMIAKKLLDENIEVHYITDKMVEQAKDYPYMFFYFRLNAHPGYGCIDVATKQMATHLVRYEPYLKPTLNEKDFSFSMKQVEGNKKHIYLVGNEKHNKGDKILCKNILYKDKKIIFPKKAKVLVIGNSFIQTPMVSKRSYSSSLAYRIKYIPQDFSIAGRGPKTVIAKTLFFNPSILAGKKVCIMPLGAVHFKGEFINLRQLDEKLLQSR
ncbi:MAG: hypothetical protein L3J71_11295 [Victivallaceae bacterium]|nr:hypothetical protein [Victivallaceae bacterium]